jgi:ligand-binding sensor domain-containing protein/two-component sensor histidine kinase
MTLKTICQFFFIFFIPVIVSNHLFAQQYPFVYYTPKDGLVNSRVRSIKQDSKGRMYFITYGGLSVYDGTRFINYRQDNGLANELVNDIAEAGPDSILVATNTQLLNTIVKGRVGVYETADKFYPLINRFLKSSDGKWYVTADDGLFVLENKSFRKLSFLDKDGKEVGVNLDRIIEWKNFFLIIPWSTEPKLFLYDRQKSRLLEATTTKNVYNVATDIYGRVWIPGKGGIEMLDTAFLTKGKLHFLPVPAGYRLLPSQLNANVFLDKQGNAWVYGGNSFQKISEDFQLQNFSTEQGLKPGTLVDMFRDREGIIWIATDGNGVIKLNGTHIQLLNRFASGRLLQLSAIGHQNDTLWIYNTEDNSIYRLHKNMIKMFPLHDIKMHPGNLLIVNQKLYLGDEQKIILIRDKNNPVSYRHPQIMAQAEPGAKSLGTAVTDAHGAIIQHVKKDDSIFLLSVFKNGRHITDYRISYSVDQMTFDRKGRLWMVTRDDHLLLFTLHPEEPLRYLQLQKEFVKDLPVQMGARSLTVDNDGNVWIGTRYKGIYYLKLKNFQIVSMEQFTAKNGLTDNFIYQLHCGPDNTIWVGTQTGLDKIFWKEGRYIISNISKTYNYFQTINRILTTTDNTVWALTSERNILKISSAPVSSAAPPPPLLLTSLQVNNRDQPCSVNRFSYHENNLSFYVAAPSFADERSIRYSYLLDGSGNNNWSEPSNNAIFNVINLATGTYTLKVRAEFPEAMYPVQLLEYSFIINAPWWQTWWFRLFAGLFFGAMVVLAVRFYYRRKLEKKITLLEKQQAIEKERTRIATDMHDDLGSGLSRIKFLSQSIQLKTNEHKSIQDDVNKIAQYSDEMVDKMGEIVWALNVKNDSLADLLSFTRAYAVEYLSLNNIRCDFTMPHAVPEIFISGEIRRNIFLSVKEALHNIIKHAAATEVIMKIEFDKKLKIIIHDNGKGIDFDHVRRFGNGLVNIQERMKTIGGKAVITNDKGALIQLEVLV